VQAGRGSTDVPLFRHGHEVFELRQTHSGQG
jgi:hypothetical protein